MVFVDGCHCMCDGLLYSLETISQEVFHAVKDSSERKPRSVDSQKILEMLLQNQLNFRQWKKVC